MSEAASQSANNGDHVHDGADHTHPGDTALKVDAHAHLAEDAHHEWSFMALLGHHNMAYPAWEVAHTPLIIFDAKDYAARTHVTVEEAREKAVIGTFPDALSWVNQQTFFGTIALILVALLVGVFGKRRADEVQPKGRLQNMIEGVVQFTRDQIVRPNIHHGDSWTPYFAALFLAILSFNLFGLIPGTGTASGNPGVTAGLAVTTLFAMLFFGMKEQGVAKYWVNLVPVHFSLKPMDLFVWLLLAVIEVMGLIMKPAALAIRLFANMFAGHTVLLSFTVLGFILFHQDSSAAMSLGMGFAGFLVAIAISFLEVLVAFIQAFVFVLLSAVFIGASIHPEH